MKRTLCLLVTIISLIIVSMLFVLPASAAETSGTCGTNASWNYYNGTLTIWGSGDMNDFGSSSQPWKAYQSEIKKVNIGYGITSVGNYKATENTDTGIHQTVYKTGTRIG